MLATITTAIITFAATNIDDIFVLMMLFSPATKNITPRQVVIGQFLGILALVLLSLIGSLGALLIPPTWLRWLGLVPIYMGVRAALSKDDDDDEAPALEATDGGRALLSPQVYKVAAITIGNGGDNLGVYIPLFAQANPLQLLEYVVIFMMLVGVWCYAGYRLGSFPVIARALQRFGGVLTPVVFIGLGLYIIFG